MIIWIKAFGFVMLGAIGLVIFVTLACAFEDFMQKHFGKPPTWLAIVSAIIWLFLITETVKRSIQ